MQSVSPGSGHVPSMNFKSADVRDQKLRVTASDQSIQDAYHEFAKLYGLGEGRDFNNKLLAAIKNIVTKYNLTIDHSDLDDVIEAIGKHVHNNQKIRKLSANNKSLVRELYVLLKIARKIHLNSTPQAVSIFNSFDRANRYHYNENDKSLSDGRNPINKNGRSKTETAWTSYFKDVLAYESGQRGRRTFELEEMFPELMTQSSTRQVHNLVRTPNTQSPNLQHNSDELKTFKDLSRKQSSSPKKDFSSPKIHNEDTNSSNKQKVKDSRRRLIVHDSDSDGSDDEEGNW